MGGTEPPENGDIIKQQKGKEDTATQTEKRKSAKKHNHEKDSKQDQKATKTEKKPSNKKKSKTGKFGNENVKDEMVDDDDDAEKMAEDDDAKSEMELEEELDITIMKQKEYLFDTQFLWNGRVKWDVVKSDIFSNIQSDNLQVINYKDLQIYSL